MALTHRRERIGDLIQVEISNILRREAKDPRLNALWSVTNVAVSMDLKYARVFVSVMGTEEEKQRVLQGLDSASGFLRRELGSRLTLRRIPQLVFQRDDSIERGAHLLQLIKEVSSEGAAHPEEGISPAAPEPRER
ncbi:MAG: 30S ribosome-binding factor RbfA [Chloroflexi bacterium]|nr:30S ribosome-binding factor RbfA [Chloroflexota bacterium]